MTKLLLIDSEKIQEVQMGQEITIGRAYSNLLRLEGEEVSRVHAILYRRGSDCVLRDLDSKNGILLNGHKVVSCTVSPGDSMQVGKYHIIFEPPAAFDLAGYLRRNSIPLPPEVLTAGRDMDTGSGLPKSGMKSTPEPEGAAEKMLVQQEEHSQASVNFRASAGEEAPRKETPQPEIFFPLAAIEEMLAAREAEPTPEFAADLIRLHRGMNSLSSGHEPGGDEEVSFTRSLLDLVVSVLKADRGVVIFYDTGEVLRLGAIVPRDRDVSVNRVVLRAALRERRALLCNDVQNDSRFNQTETVRKDSIGSLISFPLVRGVSVLGLIYCDTQDRTKFFREDHLPLLSIAGRLLLVTLGLGRTSEAER